MKIASLPTYNDIDAGNFKLQVSLGELISTIIPYTYALAGLGLFFYLIIGGFKLLTSGGDPKKAAAARQILTNAIFGFLIVIASYWVFQIVGVIFKIDVFS
ncbi:MAG TPA: hypothetical protein VMW41_00755 [Candidatus Bathyarchaeia archaeon]|nr:hypothetical protein [Candidatus Bathyarchaeia archaeon]